jgi:hypothetical protein
MLIAERRARPGGHDLTGRGRFGHRARAAEIRSEGPVITGATARADRHRARPTALRNSGREHAMVLAARRRNERRASPQRADRGTDKKRREVVGLIRKVGRYGSSAPIAPRMTPTKSSVIG